MRGEIRMDIDFADVIIMIPLNSDLRKKNPRKLLRKGAETKRRPVYHETQTLLNDDVNRIIYTEFLELWESRRLTLSICNLLYTKRNITLFFCCWCRTRRANVHLCQSLCDLYYKCLSFNRFKLQLLMNPSPVLK
jgi:hypothetical protein